MLTGVIANGETGRNAHSVGDVVTAEAIQTADRRDMTGQPISIAQPRF